MNMGVQGCLGMLAVLILIMVAFRLFFGAVGILASILGVIPMWAWVLIAVLILLGLWRNNANTTPGG